MNLTPQTLPPEPATDPCLQIQVDLSAMLDGELDPPSVRRVLVHADVCPSCSQFLQGIRTQARANVDLHDIFEGRPLAEIDPLAEINLDDPGNGARPSTMAAELRHKLGESRLALARILYELGRGHVLMGTSPKFYRAVAREPVPIPDVCMRGRNLLDEVGRLAPALQSEDAGREWVRARLLFASNERCSPAQSLEKGIGLLREVLLLRPRYHEARIYLGHAYHIRQDRDLARHEFRIVLADTDDLIMRAFALENLGNVDLEEGFPARAIPHFLELLDSGVIRREPRFFTTYFNLALAYGLLQEFDACVRWLERLYAEFPHKRAPMRRELRARAQFAATVASHPDIAADLARRFPDWFPLPQVIPSPELH
ncbi:MAG: zf-HC2 domain-containing protein [Planctomycetota bacterium]